MEKETLLKKVISHTVQVTAALHQLHSSVYEAPPFLELPIRSS